MALHIVTLGGGTGQFHVLQALMQLRNARELRITAIPTTLDSGGSSGELRLAYHIIAPGDISQCIFGLHPRPDHAAWLFEHRFAQETTLGGHSARNIIVTAALQRFGATQEALDAIRDTFRLAGTIAPVTFSSANVNVELKDGTHLKNEDEIYGHDVVASGGVVRAWLEPDVEPNDVALRAIRNADVIITTPGTLLSSIVPNFLVPGVREELIASRATKIYIANLMNRRGHVPDDWGVIDHVECLEEYLCPQFFGVIIANTARLNADQEELYRKDRMIAPSLDGFDGNGRRLIATPLLSEVRHAPADTAGDALAHLRATVRHDPDLLADALTVALSDDV
jgi:uncharacterized cofD-like protein